MCACGAFCQDIRVEVHIRLHGKASVLEKGNTANATTLMQHKSINQL